MPKFKYEVNKLSFAEKLTRLRGRLKSAEWRRYGEHYSPEKSPESC